jgi:hypothetical protein
MKLSCQGSGWPMAARREPHLESAGPAGGGGGGCRAVKQEEAGVELGGPELHLQHIPSRPAQHIHRPGRPALEAARQPTTALHIAPVTNSMDSSAASTQGCISGVGTSWPWEMPLLMTHTASAPSSSASSMYSYRPRPEERIQRAGRSSCQQTPALQLSAGNQRARPRAAAWSSRRQRRHNAAREPLQNRGEGCWRRPRQAHRQHSSSPTHGSGGRGARRCCQRRSSKGRRYQSRRPAAASRVRWGLLLLLLQGAARWARGAGGRGGRAAGGKLRGPGRPPGPPLRSSRRGSARTWGAGP